MPFRTLDVRSPKLVPVTLAFIAAVTCGAGACKDPNPTFSFDASSDGNREASGDGAGPTDASGQAGRGGAGGAAGSGGSGGAAGQGGGIAGAGGSGGAGG